jgi:hypothetical protein
VGVEGQWERDDRPRIRLQQAFLLAKSGADTLTGKGWRWRRFAARQRRFLWPRAAAFFFSFLIQTFAATRFLQKPREPAVQMLFETRVRLDVIVEEESHGFLKKRMTG